MCVEFENNSASMILKTYICTCITASDILYLTRKIFASRNKLFSSKAITNTSSIPNYTKVCWLQTKSKN